MNKYKFHIIWAVVAVVALGAGYFWGKASAKPSFGNGQFGAGGQFVSSTRRFAAGGGQVLTTGQITAMDSSSITLQLPNGNSENVFYSSSTQVSEPTAVPVADLKVGSNVAVGGTQNSDGSFTATSIQVRPAGSVGGFNGRGG